MRNLILFLSLFALVAKAAPAPRELTILVYAAGDEEEVKAPTAWTLQQFERVPGLTTTGNVAVVAQHDDNGDDPNYRYQLRYVPNLDEKKLAPNSPPIAESEVAKLAPGFRYHELDSAHPLTLKEFLRWGIQAYPARHYILVMAGHSWGHQGLMQDFFVRGRELGHSHMLRNYELRRVMEETYREQGKRIPAGKFDALILDGCIFGQFDVLYEIGRQFRYFVGPALETPFHSVPYEQSLPAYVNHLAKHPGRTGATWDRDFETTFLRPLVSTYTRSHVRGSAVVPLEKGIDPVELMAIRTSALDDVARLLKSTLAKLPTAASEDWAAGKIPSLEQHTDQDSYIDLWMLADDLAAYAGKQNWKDAQAAAVALRNRLGSPATDPTVEKKTIASGSWLHLEIDEWVQPRDLAICQALRAFGMQNVDTTFPLPVYKDEKGEAYKAHEYDCGDMLTQAQKKKFNPRNVYDRSTPIHGMFNGSFDWPSGIPAYLTEVKAADHKGAGARYLSIWAPKRESAKPWTLRLRTPGTQHVWVNTLDAKTKPVSWMQGEDRVARWQKSGKVLTFPALVEYVKPTDFTSDLYVAEAHTNGAHFKRGMGLYLSHTLDTYEGNYQNGREPIEWWNPSSTLEKYFEHLKANQEGEKSKIFGPKFYRAHRISETGWPDFFLGRNDELVKQARREFFAGRRHTRTGIGKVKQQQQFPTPE